MTTADPAPASSTTHTLALPTQIGGFRIRRIIGQGGMATVYLAEQVSLGRQVALKLMAPHITRHPQAVERFLREARAAAAINHPHVVGIIDVGQHDGQLYMALELVTGGDAAGLAHANGGTLPEDRALALVEDCCKGLQALHDARLVHRDLKPSNVFITRDGSAKLGDLGLARSQDGDDRMTITGQLVGTPAFMSPEQAGGEAPLDTRSDIYALGATLFALVTGRQPFVANTPIAVAAKALVEPAPDPRTFAPHLSTTTAEVILRCMAKDPAARFQTPDELCAALAEARARLAGDTPTAPAASRPSRWPSGMLGVAVMALAGVVALSWLRPWGPTPPAQAVPTPAPADPAASGGPPAPTPAPPPVLTARGEHPVGPPPEGPDPQPPAWASAQGRDGYGHWCEVTVGAATQRLRWLPPGTATIGSPADEPGHSPIEALSRVTFTFGVWLADTECTQAFWQAVTGHNPSSVVDQTLPVTDVSLLQATAFTHQLAQQLIGTPKVRLPSRSEWERACRAGSRTAYATGDAVESLAGFANLNDMGRHRALNSRQVVTFSDGFIGLAPVASFNPNPWGYHDLHGNSFEFCLALNWEPLASTASDPEIDDNPLNQRGFIRGGAFSTEDADKTRCAAMPYIGRETKSGDLGFRFLIEAR